MLALQKNSKLIHPPIPVFACVISPLMLHSKKGDTQFQANTSPIYCSHHTSHHGLS
jgi:hypothetical protein